MQFFGTKYKNSMFIIKQPSVVNNTHIKEPPNNAMHCCLIVCATSQRLKADKEWEFGKKGIHKDAYNLCK